MRTKQDQLKAHLSDIGYSDTEIEEGIKYAESVGYSDINECGSLALTYILYSDSQIENGAYFEFMMP